MDFDGSDGLGHLMVAVSFNGSGDECQQGRGGKKRQNNQIKATAFKATAFNSKDVRWRLKVATMDDGIQWGQQ